MEEQVEALMQALTSTNHHERAVAAIELGDSGTASALPAIRKLVDEEDDIVAMAGMYAAHRLGEDRISVRRFVSALQSGQEEVVQQAVHTICRLGDDMVPKLLPLLGESSKTAMLALRLLAEIGGAGARAAVLELKSEDLAVNELARELLEDWDDDD